MERILKHKKLIVCMVVMSSFFFLTCSVSAGFWDDIVNFVDKIFNGRSDQNIIDALKKFPMSQNNIISYCGHAVGWFIVTGLRYIVNALEAAMKIVNQIFNHLSEAPAVQELIEKVQVISIALFGAVLVYIGIEYMIKKDQNKDFNTYVLNLVVGVIVAISISTAIPSLYSISEGAIDWLGDVNLGDKVVLNNITDNFVYHDYFFADGSPSKLNNLNVEGEDENAKKQVEQNLKEININEWIKKSEGEPYNKYIYKSANGEEKLVEIDEGTFGVNILGNMYYRWKVNWFSVIAQLIIMTFAMAILAVKIVRLCYELVIHQIMAQALAFLDVHSGQRLKECLRSIISTFITIFGCFLLLQLYVAANDFITTNTDISGNPVALIICMLGLAISVVDGPNIFEKIVGVDAGLNNTTSAILGAHGIMGGARFLGRGTKGLAHGVSSAASGAKKAAGVAGGAAGVVAGTMAGKKAAKAGTNPLFAKSPGGVGTGGSGGIGGANSEAPGTGGDESAEGIDVNESIQQNPSTGVGNANSTRLSDMSAKEFSQVLKDTMSPPEKPQTLGDRFKNRKGAEKSTVGRTRNAYNLTKEAAFNSAMRKDYINTRATQLENKNIFSNKEEDRKVHTHKAKKGYKAQAKNDYKTTIDKHFGG